MLHNQKGLCTKDLLYCVTAPVTCIIHTSHRRCLSPRHRTSNRNGNTLVYSTYAVCDRATVVRQKASLRFCVPLWLFRAHRAGEGVNYVTFKYNVSAERSESTGTELCFLCVTVTQHFSSRLFSYSTGAPSWSFPCSLEEIIKGPEPEEQGWETSRQKWNGKIYSGMFRMRIRPRNVCGVFWCFYLGRCRCTKTKQPWRGGRAGKRRRKSFV